MATLCPLPKLRFDDANGNPLAGGKLYSYMGGTDTLVATVADSSGLTPNANPVILDARGEATVWLNPGTYKFVLKNSADVTQWTVDYVIASSEVGMLALKANLSAIPLVSITAGSAYMVLAREVAGDNGGGLFRWDSSNLSTAVSNDVRQGIYVPPDNANTGASGAWVRVFTGDIRSEWFGVKANGSTDDTAALQGAIDTADYLNPSNSTCRTLRLAAGDIKVSSTIVWKNVDLVGDSEPNVGTVIVWNGASGGTVLRKDGTGGGNGSFQLLSGVQISGSGTAAICVDMTSLSTPVGLIDKFFQIWRCQLTSATECGLKLGFVVNCHLQHLRFDSPGDYAIKIIVPNGQNASSYVLRDFTYDNSGGSAGKGFLYFENNTPFAGLVRLESARIELAQAWTGTEKAVFHYNHAGGGGLKAARFQFSEISFDPTTGTGYNFFYRQGSASNDVVHFINCKTPGSSKMAAVMGGTYDGFQSKPSNVADGSLDWFVTTNLGATAYSAAPGSQYAADGYAVFSSTVQGESNARWVNSAYGKMQWGGGSGAVDCTLERNGAGQLKTDSDFILSTVGKGLKIKEGTNATMGTAVLVAGTVTVATTKVTANSRIFVLCQAPGGTPGFLRISARNAGVDFTILSSDVADTSTVAWMIIEPS